MNKLWNSIKRPEVFVVAIACIPIIIALIRALHSGVLPMGDFANVEIRSRDVFSLDHFPLLGTSSSTFQIFEIPINHPGPMLFFICAPFVSIFGGASGLAMAVATINGVSIVGLAVVGYRLFGQIGSITATLAGAIMTWALGSGLLTAAWNPYVLVLPCLLLLLLAAGVANGNGNMLPWLLIVGSFCVQTHLGYVFIAAGLCLFAVFMLGIQQYQIRRTGVTDTHWKRSWLWGTVALLTVWAPPIWEQIFVGGNIGNLLESASKDVPRIGLALAVRIVAAVEALPPWWSRGALSNSIPAVLIDPQGNPTNASALPSLTISILAVSILMCVLLIVAIMTHRAQKRQLTIVIALSAFAMVLAVFASSNSLLTIYKSVASYNLLWLWPFGAFIGFALVNSVVTFVPRQIKYVSFVRLFAGLIIIFSALAMPKFEHRVHQGNEHIFGKQNIYLKQILQQLDNLKPQGTVLVDTTNEPFNCPYYSAIMAYLQRREIDFNVTESQSGTVAQMGPERATTGDETIRIRIFVGRSALAHKSSVDMVAFADPLTTAEKSQLSNLEAELVAEVLRGNISLSKEGRDLAVAGLLELDIAGFDKLFSTPRRLIEGGMGMRLFRTELLEMTSNTQHIFQELDLLLRKVENVAITVEVHSN